MDSHPSFVCVASCCARDAASVASWTATPAACALRPVPVWPLWTPCLRRTGCVTSQRALRRPRARNDDTVRCVVDSHPGCVCGASCVLVFARGCCVCLSLWTRHRLRPADNAVDVASCRLYRALRPCASHVAAQLTRCGCAMLMRCRLWTNQRTPVSRRREASFQFSVPILKIFDRNVQKLENAPNFLVKQFSLFSSDKNKAASTSASQKRRCSHHYVLFIFRKIAQRRKPQRDA